MCKICFMQKYSRQSLWSHIKYYKHAVHALKKALPYLYQDYVFSFRTLSSLSSHLSKYHFVSDSAKGQYCSLQCEHCGVCSSSVHAFLLHLRVHVRQNETVFCPVCDCNFKTNVIGT